MSYFLGIDAGGTKTDYALADETRVLARVRTGTIKRMRTDSETATANLETALAELTEISGVSMQTITRTCIGTAGETVPLVTDFLRGSITPRVSGELILIGDVEIALDAAFQGGMGVLVLAGTGSNVAGRAADGALTTAGGWGPALADQGSGHRIGHEALRAAFLAKDEGRPSALLERILAFWSLASIDLLVEFANRRPSPDFSRLTELVLKLAGEGDPVASTVLRKEGEDLAWLVRLVIRRLQAPNNAGELPAIAFAGSIMENVLPVREALIASLQSEFPAIRALDGVIDPVAGAIWRARTGVTSQPHE
jgi:N-acetylglucosamine kinase-like BadF-type ATPase